MARLYWYREVINLSLMLAMLVFYLCLKHLIEPSRGIGFYCNDFSVALPYKPSTVNDVWLHVILIVVPIAVVLGTEFARGMQVQGKHAIKRKRYRVLFPMKKQLTVEENLGI